MPSWKLTIHAPKGVVSQALDAQDNAVDWDYSIVVSGHEIAEDRPEDWVFEAWLHRRPTKADRATIAALFDGGAPQMVPEKLPDEDWLTLSQQGVDPIRAGPFHVRTPDHAPPEDEWLDLVIPASMAFGTGQHETTAGCLAMLSGLRVSGVNARNIADIGTGTGLLAFGAMALWPGALVTASDIDPICEGVVLDNALTNTVPLGGRTGELLMVVADGMDDPLLQLRGPFDLLIANILAQPLIDLAPDFANSVTAGGHLVLAGLLETQEAAVRTAYRKAGFRLAGRIVNGDWSILWLRRRRSF